MPTAPNRLDAAAEAAERDALQEVLDAWPDLNSFGFGVFDPVSKAPAQIAAKVAEGHEEPLAPEGVAMFAAARGWLRQFPKRQAINKSGTSHGLKHVAEDAVGYVYKGAFIAAAIAGGFKVRHLGPNAFLGVSAKAWAAGRPEAAFTRSPEP